MSAKLSEKNITRTRDWSSFLGFDKKWSRKKCGNYLTIVNVIEVTCDFSEWHTKGVMNLDEPELVWVDDGMKDEKRRQRWVMAVLYKNLTVNRGRGIDLFAGSFSWLLISSLFYLYSLFWCLNLMSKTKYFPKGFSSVVISITFHNNLEVQKT